ncbi:MAG TPA: hypothetical protein VF796_18935 [Humisphaera sp.]
MRIRRVTGLAPLVALSACAGGCMMPGMTYKFPPPQSVSIGSDRGDEATPSSFGRYGRQPTQSRAAGTQPAANADRDVALVTP